MSIHLRTYVRHAWYSALRGPSSALAMQFSAFVAIKSLGATEGQALLLSFAMPVGNLLGWFWSGHLATRRRVPFIFWVDLASHLLLPWIAFVTNPLVFIALIFVHILLKMAPIPAISAITRDNYPATERARTAGKVQSWNLASVALAGFICGRVLDHHPDSYQFIYPFVGVLGLLSVMCLRGMPESDPAARARATDTHLSGLVRVLSDDRDFRRYQASFFFFGFSAIMYTSLLPLYLASELQLNYEDGAAALVVITTIIPVLTSPLWGRMIDRMNILTLRGVFNFVWAVSPLMVCATGTKWGVYAGQIITGCILGGSYLIWDLGVHIFAKKDDVAVYQGVHQTLTGVRGALAPAIGYGLTKLIEHSGMPADTAYRIVFAISGVSMLFSGWFMMSEGRRVAKKGRPTMFTSAEAVPIPTGVQPLNRG